MWLQDFLADLGKTRGHSRYKVDYVIEVYHILNIDAHTNQITDPKGMAILPKEWILPVGGVASVNGHVRSLHLAVLFYIFQKNKNTMIKQEADLTYDANPALLTPRVSIME